MGGQVIPETKPWYKSSTIWINIVPVAAVMLDTILQTNAIKDKDVLALIVATANILNRLRTTKGISF